MNRKLISKNQGFTLIEILVVIGIIAILAAVVLIAINPARQFAQARNSQRTSNVDAILNAIGQNIAENKGIFTCNGVAYALPTDTLTPVTNSSTANIAPCLVPTYLSAMPFDPGGSAYYTSNTDYNTGYRVVQSSSTGRITVDAPAALNDAATSSISITR